MERICNTTGKHCYPSRAEASKARARMRNGSRGKGLCVYRCPHCNRWHYGHPIRNKRVNDIKQHT